jgi:hypothetical protein
MKFRKPLERTSAELGGGRVIDEGIIFIPKELNENTNTASNRIK